MAGHGVPFHRNLLLDLVETGERGTLCVIAEGLGVVDILLHFTRLYSSASFLVFMLNTHAEEEAELLTEAAKCDLSIMPHSLNSTMKASERELIYSEGGVVFASPVVLVADFLGNRIPKKGVTGILINGAEDIVRWSPTAFAVRLFREMNCVNSFVRAFSSKAASLPARLTEIMDAISAKELILWPRFRKEVSESIDRQNFDVVELSVNPTEAVMKIQKCLVLLLRACLGEMRRLFGSNTELDFSVQGTLFRKASKSLRREEMDKLPPKAQQKFAALESDLEILRNLSLLVNRLDAVSFFHYLNSWRVIMSSHSLWTTFDETAKLFEIAMSRCFIPGDGENTVIHLLEESGKWALLRTVLAEIDDSRSEAKDDGGEVLILCKDEYTSTQLTEVITKSPQAYLTEKYNQFLADNYPSVSRIPVPESTWESEMKKNPKIGENSPTEEAQGPPLPRHLLIRSHSEVSPLRDISPSYIVIYDPDKRFIRQTEMYAYSSTSSSSLRVYFLMLKNSFEEEHFLGSIQRENDAFETLIKIKIKLSKRQVEDVVIPDSVDNSGTSDKVQHSSGCSSPVVGSKGLVVVDTRELRSAVPFLLYNAGFKLKIQQLSVGDYIATPSMGIERKSYSDLVQSLNSGRIYKQLDALCNYYLYPILLIEFDRTSSPFTLCNNGVLGPVMSRKSVLNRVAILLYNYPKLRLVWLRSDEIPLFFERVKANTPDPDVTVSRKVGNPSIEGYLEQSNQAVEFLLRCPGVNRENYSTITQKVTNLRELSRMSLDDLTPLLGEDEKERMKIHPYEVKIKKFFSL